MKRKPPRRCADCGHGIARHPEEFIRPKSVYSSGETIRGRCNVRECRDCAKWSEPDV